MSTRTVIMVGMVLALALAAFVSPFASSAPDGLERVAEDHGIVAAERPVWTGAVLPNYQTPGMAHQGVATGMAGVIGTFVVFVIALGVGRLLGRPRKEKSVTTRPGG